LLYFSILASSSKGNALYVEHQQQRLLIDAGLPESKLRLRLQLLGRNIADLTGVFISHEHLDHVQGVGTIVRKYKVPLYITEETYQCLPKSVGTIPKSACIFIQPEEKLTMESLTILPLELSHDAKLTLGFKLNCPEASLAIITDLGYLPAKIIDKLNSINTLILESNHDTEMLMHGKYPWYLKKRIISDTGHLSNTSAAEALSKILRKKGEQVYLGHLSAKNNTPDLALLTIRKILSSYNIKPNHDFSLAVAKHHDLLPAR
jgi:phosphoribosyl 1,2-cyclic phosphodiesterase